jgi:hypothetical protein
MNRAGSGRGRARRAGASRRRQRPQHDTRWSEALRAARRARDVVSVVGTWSAARGGLIVEPGKGDSLRLWKGKPPGLGSLAFFSVGDLLKAAIALAVVLIPMAALHAFVSLDVVEGFRPDFQASWPEVRIESILDAELRPRIAAAGLGPVPEVDPGRGLAAGEAQGSILAGDLAGRKIGVSRIPIRAFTFAPLERRPPELVRRGPGSSSQVQGVGTAFQPFWGWQRRRRSFQLRLPPRANPLPQ